MFWSSPDSTRSGIYCTVVVSRCRFADLVKILMYWMEHSDLCCLLSDSSTLLTFVVWPLIKILNGMLPFTVMKLDSTWSRSSSRIMHGMTLVKHHFDRVKSRMLKQVVACVSAENIGRGRKEPWTLLQSFSFLESNRLAVQLTLRELIKQTGINFANENWWWHLLRCCLADATDGLSCLRPLEHPERYY